MGYMKQKYLRNKRFECRASEAEIKEIDDMVKKYYKVSYSYVSRIDVILKAIRYANGEFLND